MRNLAEKKLSVEPTGILKYLNAATGADYTLEELMQAGERIINAERQTGLKKTLLNNNDTIVLFSPVAGG